MPVIGYEKLLIALIRNQIARMPKTNPIIALVNVVAPASVDQNRS
jgi:hypothetical protein